MKHPVAFFLILLMSACVADSPAPGYSRSDFSAVEFEGDRFNVYTEATGNCVEVHRTNAVFPPPSRLETLLKMQIVAEHVTGCRVRAGTFTGDQAVGKGRLSCHDPSGRTPAALGSCRVKHWGGLWFAQQRSSAAAPPS